MRSFDRLIGLLSEIPDPRRREGKLYQLPYVLLFSILAVVTGGNSYRSIETFITVHRRRLNTAFGLRWKRAPAHTAIRYILQGLDPKAVEQAFRRHAAGLLDGAWSALRNAPSRSMEKCSGEASTTSPTAKQLNCCTRSTPKPAWSWRISISTRSPTRSPPPSNCLANSRSRTAPSRSMHCTAKKTFEAAAQAQAHAIIQLKDNQPTLLQNAETACASLLPTSSDTSITTARNRHEARTADVFSADRVVANTEWKPLIKGIVRVTRDVLHRSAKTGLWSSTSEVAYYLAGSAVSASHSATAIRSHWHVENKLHYTRDVTFQKDQSRIRHNPGVFARIRSFGYNILRRNQTRTFSQDRYAAALAGLDAIAKWCIS